MRFATTIGFFDGVHRGHQYVLEHLITLARQADLKAAVITFSEHPLEIIRGEHKPLLTTTQERVELLKEQQLDEIFCFNFDVIKDFSAAQFLQILHDNCGVDMLLMGYDHHFGSDRLREFNQYKQAGLNAGVNIIELEEYKQDGEHISSTAIRRLLLDGRVVEANQLLGYQYKFSGVVVHGRHIGRQIGFPTANVDISDRKIIPADGVYGVDVKLEHGAVHKAIVNIGCNPTLGAEQRTIEVHIPDFNQQIYGKQITIIFRKFIRHEMTFASLDQLRKQIATDVSQL